MAPTTPAALVRQVQAALAPLADPDRARQMADYQRGQFPFLGIGAEPRRAAVGKPGGDLSADALLDAAALLWDLPEREYKYAAADLLLRAVRRLDAGSLDAILALAQREPWWDTVDALANVAGTLVRRVRDDAPAALTAMDAALVHESMWVRRIAMLHQRGWRLDTDDTRLFRYALALSHETDFFIRKAIGWALRDYRRWNPTAVDTFLAAHGDRFAPLTVREAQRQRPTAGFQSEKPGTDPDMYRTQN